MNNDYLKLAVSAAQKAGEYLKQRRDIRVDEDLMHDIKLSTDKAAEKIILDELFPSGLFVLTEESGIVGNESELKWIIDPLDGTVNYFKDLGELSCVSIALYKNNEPLIGVVNRFVAEELFVGVVGNGATLNGKQIQTSGVTKLNNAVMATGFPNAFELSNDNLIYFINRVKRVKKVRMLGTAAIMGTFVSCGRVDLYSEMSIRLWDVAAAAAIVKAAEGAISLKAHENDKLFRCDFACAATDELLKEYEYA
ncbi:MAG: hypothetical protein LBS62_05290 [Clostridiales bacterium]|jgi:myo-inositol-1(or 4)-monophosphatase|nr:hypothetical protein [Clostridiales bacterium]